VIGLFHQESHHLKFWSSVVVVAVELMGDLAAVVALFTQEPSIGAQIPIEKSQSRSVPVVLVYSIRQTLREALELHQLWSTPIKTLKL
jgi:hypothetical protein